MPNSGSATHLHAAALVVPELKELLARKAFPVLKQGLRELHPVDLAESWECFEPEEQVQLFQLLSTAGAVKLFESLPMEDQRFLLMTLGDESAPVIEGLNPADVARLFHRVPKKVAKKLAGFVKREESLQKIQLLMTFPPGTAGSHMHPEFIRMTPQMTAKQALDTLQAVARPHQGDHLYALYVTNGQGRLAGALTLQDLISAPPDAKLSELMTSTEAIKIPATMDQEEVARRFAKYDLVHAPVMDAEDRLIGILTVDDIIDVMRQEATEDVLRMGAVEEIGGPYLQVGLFRMIRKRAGWLCALFLGEMLTATAMGYYQHEIARAVVLALFIPLVISSGGNSGSQASTLIVRAMALQHVRIRDWFRVMRRELLAGLLLGSILGMIAFVRIALWPTRVALYGEHYLMIALTVGTALVGVVMFGTITGSMLPFVLRRLGFDPAVASAPFVATLVDVTGLIIYFTVASLLLAGIVL